MSKGKLELIMGCMFSSKTNKLFELATPHLGKNILGINYKGNIRYNTGKIITHDQKSFEFTHELQVLELNKIIIDEFYPYYKTSEIIVIDEIQFFKDAYDFIYNAVNKDKKHIICAGLNGDFQKNPFENIYRLIPEADEIYYLKANCECGNKASFSKRLSDNSEQIVIGSSDIYKPVCRNCY
tara:strand:- start:195 stop:740 length:546 start_codon:yes stop_codon:yes gene_type:complete